MKLIKLALISLVVLFLILTGISLLIPSTIRVSRAVNINADKEQIIPQLADLRQWKHWNLLFSDTAGNTVFDYKVIHTDNLQVELEKTKSDSVITRWHKKNGDDLVSGFACFSQGEVTVVQWYFDFHLNWYPWEKFASIIYDKQMGPVMERSLAQLKKQLESPL